MQSTAKDNHDFETSLRDQLIAAQHGFPPTTTQPEPQVPQVPEQQYSPPPTQQPSGPPPQAHRLDPSITGQHIPPYPMAVTTGEDNSPAANKAAAKAQRELSTTKRAAQNRAAQRAFRQRKEQYILTLEDDIQRYRIMEQDFKALQDDNNALRNYIMQLQGKLSEAKLPFPPAPSTARVALPNPVIYDIGEPAAPQGPPALTAEQPTFTAPASAAEDQYLPDSRPDVHEDQRQQPQPQPQYLFMQQFDKEPPSDHGRRESYQATGPPPPNNNPTDDIPPDAFERLRAAAAQAGELDTNPQLPPSLRNYAPAEQPPLKRARLEEAESTSNRGSAGSVLRGLLNQFTRAKA